MKHSHGPAQLDAACCVVQQHDFKLRSVQSQKQPCGQGEWASPPIPLHDCKLLIIPASSGCLPLFGRGSMEAIKMFTANHQLNPNNKMNFIEKGSELEFICNSVNFDFLFKCQGYWFGCPHTSFLMLLHTLPLFFKDRSTNLKYSFK